MIFREMNPISITKKKARYSLSLSLGAAWAPPDCRHCAVVVPAYESLKAGKGTFFSLVSKNEIQ